MGTVIVKQPNGKYAMFSSVVDNFVWTDATAEELAKDAADNAYRNCMDRIKKLDDRPETMFGVKMTYEQCLEDIELLSLNEDEYPHGSLIEECSKCGNQIHGYRHHATEDAYCRPIEVWRFDCNCSRTWELTLPITSDELD